MESILELSEDGKTIIGVKDKNVTLITIPNSVTTIGDYAFCGCSSLQSIDIPNSVTTIGNDAFSGRSSLQSINITKGNKHYESIDGILFSKDLTCILKLPERKKLKEYTIPNSVTTIEDSAFDGCSSLQSIDIPNSVTTIENGAFSGCSSLQSIHLHWTNLLDIKISDTTLRDRTEDCTLYIPPGTRWEYRHHSIWGNFKNIEIEKQE